MLLENAMVNVFYLSCELQDYTALDNLGYICCSLSLLDVVIFLV